MTPEEKASEELFGTSDYYDKHGVVLTFKYQRADLTRALWEEVVQWYKDNPDAKVQE